MCINRFTKIAFGIIFVVTAQPFFGMESKPAVCAATQSVAPEGQLLLNAVRRRNIEMVRSLIEQGVQIDYKGICGFTALHWAVEKKNLPMIQYLLEQGADINAQSTRGKTSLILAILPSTFIIYPIALTLPALSLEIVKALINHGANLYIKDDQNLTALDYAQQEHLNHITDYLVEKITSRSVLHALHLCNECAPADDSNCAFPPELIDRVLRPVTTAALSGK